MTPPTSLFTDDLADLASRLESAHARFAELYPGDSPRRQPLHTVYGGAHLFRADTAEKLGSLALRALDGHAPDAATFAAAIGLGENQAFNRTIYDRVREKLRNDPVEDFRIDFEDGYGTRPDSEEDSCAEEAAREVAEAADSKSLPPFIGIRIKPVSAEFATRALRTLDLFVTTLARATGGPFPNGFVVTLPKVVDRVQVETVDHAITRIEAATGLQPGSVRMELMIETTQSILGSDGSCAIRGLVDAAGGRCTGAHFGVYDYTAECSIVAEHQTMAHPCCDFARHMMQVGLGGSGVHLSDGATNILPVGPHTRSELTAKQSQENREAVHRAWRLHADDVRRSLRHGFYQGWDLHPAQLPTRYAAAYEFFLRGLDTAADRLRNFVEKAARATLAGDIFDDAATGQGLLNFFLRGLSCGAIKIDEAAATGLTLEELRSRSFARILASRAGDA